MAETWRLYSALSFLSQIFRVPILVSIADSREDLENYFIVVATSIPIQFIGGELFQFADVLSKKSKIEKIGIPLVAITSVAYVTCIHGSTFALPYISFVVALLFYSVSVGELRRQFKPQIVILVEAGFNIITGVLAVTGAFLLRSVSNLGDILVYIQVGCFLSAGYIVNKHIVKCAKPKFVENTWQVSESKENSFSKESFYLLVGLMLCTHVERLVVAGKRPQLLVSIALAGGILQGWRKISFDDSIVFSRIKTALTADLFVYLSSELLRARKVFYIPLLAILPSVTFLPDFHKFIAAKGVFKSLTVDDWCDTWSVFCVYIAAAPVSIMMINLLRHRYLPIIRLGWFAVATILAFQLLCLFFVNNPTINFYSPLASVIISAFLNHFLLASIKWGGFLAILETLCFDVIVFIITSSLVLWIRFR